MFNNIGGKLKELAKIVFVLGVIASVSFAIALFTGDLAKDFGQGEKLIFGLIVIVAGIVASWVSTWFIYGFGEIIDKLTDIEYNTRKESKETESETTE